MSLPKPATPHLDPTHPFNLTAVAVLALTEGTGQPAMIQGPHGGGSPVTAPTATFWGGATHPTWITNSEGTGLRFGASTNSLGLGVDSGTVGTWMPTGDMTMLLVRGKLDTTLDSIFFRHGSSGDFDIYLPFTDGVLYFDYGGTSSPHRLSKSGLSYPASRIDYWVFTAGGAGSAVWQNGTKQASQGTAITRTGSNLTPFLAQSVESQDVNFWQINDSQWDDTLIASWFANPYAGLYTATTAVGTATGTATVLGVGGYRIGGAGGKHSGFGSQKPARRLHGIRKR